MQFILFNATKQDTEYGHKTNTFKIKGSHTLEESNTDITAVFLNYQSTTRTTGDGMMELELDGVGGIGSGDSGATL